MAIRIIREDGDEVLRKKARVVDEIDDRIAELVKDMAETMYDADGVGLAAPQVGILKRIVVIDVGEGLLELINPKIVMESGGETDIEGCLSVPDVVGEVVRPTKVTVEAKNLKGQDIVVEGEGLLARALCHEIDHLNGVLFTDRAQKIINKSDLNNERRQNPRKID
ncbi:MAG TPA: peptide deformylase [Pseudobacteroides sp.]|uniref:peptide deformylase n=1 Tax=Pseudobacteroides sp. TaxID=1968840 RepID=UPI002F942812